MNCKNLVVIADDQIQVRSALKLLLAQYDSLEIAGEATDAMSLLLTVANKQPDVVLLDWELPGLPAEQLVRLLRQERPLLKIVAMSSRPEAEQQVRETGTQLFLSKNEPPDNLLSYVQEFLLAAERTAAQNNDLTK